MTRDHSRRFGPYLAYSLLASLLALPAGALLGSLVLTGSAMLLATSDASVGAWIEHAIFVVIAAILFGIVPVLVYGAPLFAIAAYFRGPRISSALWISLLPVAVLMLFIPALPVQAYGTLAVFSISVAAILHGLACRRLAALWKQDRDVSFPSDPSGTA